MDSDQSDVEFVIDNVRNNLLFNSIQDTVAFQLCRKLQVECGQRYSFSTDACVLGAPCKNVKITVDDNCFFRAVSVAVSCTEDHHRRIREAVVNHLQSNEATYTSLLKKWLPFSIRLHSQI